MSSKDEVPRFETESIQFDCPDPRCEGHGVFFPRTRAVQHSMPTCELWASVSGNEEKTADYLISAGIPIGKPVSPAERIADALLSQEEED